MRLILTDIDEPFALYQAWPVADGSVEIIDINYCIAHLPRANPRTQEEDGLVVFMQEAFRALQPGGSLSVRAIMPANPNAIADPYAQRFINEGTFLHFGKPSDVEEHSWSWKKMSRDHGTRFNIVHVADDNGMLFVTMEKP